MSAVIHSGTLESAAARAVTALEPDSHTTITTTSGTVIAIITGTTVIALGRAHYAPTNDIRALVLARELRIPIRHVSTYSARAEDAAGTLERLLSAARPGWSVQEDDRVPAIIHIDTGSGEATVHMTADERGVAAIVTTTSPGGRQDATLATVIQDIPDLIAAMHTVHAHDTDTQED